MSDIITTLHPENDEGTNLYPNIKRENIPNGAVDETKLDDSVKNILNGIDERLSTAIASITQPKYYSTLPTSDVGLIVFSDGYLYSWNGTAYTSTGVLYQATQISEDNYVIKKIKSRLDYMDKIRNRYIEPYNLIDKSVVLANSVFQNSGWAGNQGVVIQGNGTIYIFPIEPSTAYYLTQITNVLYNAVFYDSNMNFITHLYPTAPSFNNGFTSPSNAYYIGFMYIDTYENTMYLGKQSNLKLWQNGEKFKLTSEVNKDFTLNKNKIIKDNIETLYDSSSLSLDVSNCKYNYTIGFNGYINTSAPTFELCIAHGKTSAWAGSFVTIDNTYLKVYSRQNNQDNLISTFEHNLTFTNFINVTVSINDNKQVTIVINTNNGSYTAASSWIGCQGSISANMNIGQLLNSTLTFYCNDYNKDVWLFGDSYFDFWCPISKNKKFNKGMFDAFGGRTSAQAYSSLQKCLEFNTPKFIVWCMGMNNPDSSTAVNSEWNTTLNNLKTLCELKHITLILTTIPTTTTYNNKYKNIIVRTSGYRFIDVARSVGANDDNGNWYSGLKASDEIHPTALGSNVIANYFDIMLPELYEE